MKKRTYHLSSFSYLDLLNSVSLNNVKGGTEGAEEEYEIIYINGVPYRVKKNSTGQIIKIQPL
ncbi:MAG: hypothetical protein PHH25_08275 [Bacteroidales bacterium]|nr:hypothetical protein [Bacteroidales bacterium]MDD4582347.1 hypothetical protein [Bacteroidales bacterium]